MLPIFPQTNIGYPVVRRPYFSTIVNTAASGLEVRIGNYLYPLSEWDLLFEWLQSGALNQVWQTLYGFYVDQFGKFGAFLFEDKKDNTTSPADPYAAYSTKGIQLLALARADISYPNLNTDQWLVYWTQVTGVTLTPAQVADLLLDLGIPPAPRSTTYLTITTFLTALPFPTPSIIIADGVTVDYQIGRCMPAGSVHGFEPIFDIKGTPTVTPTPTSISPTGLMSWGGPLPVGTQIKMEFKYYWRVRFAEDDLEFSNFGQYLWEAKKITLRQCRV